MAGRADEIGDAAGRALRDVGHALKPVAELPTGLMKKQKRNQDGVEEIDTLDGASGQRGGIDSARGVDRGDGRDHLGHYANGQENKPWVDKEKLGLENYAADNDVDVISTQVKVNFDGAPQDGRKYDGLVKNDDGPNTYDGIEVKSGTALDSYERPGNTQFQFDNAVNAGTPAAGRLDGEDILVTRVLVWQEE